MNDKSKPTEGRDEQATPPSDPPPPESTAEQELKEARLSALLTARDAERAVLRDTMPTTGGGLVPKTLGEMMELSRILAGSSMVPKDYIGNAGNVMVAIQMGAEVGLGPMQAIQNIAVINGRPAVWGDAMLGIVVAHPDFEGINEMDEKDIGELQAAVCVIKRKGRDPYTATFSVEDAKKAKLWGKDSPWQTYPNRMLKMRARAFACRDVFPDALRGLSSAEEQRDVITVKAEVVEPVDQPGAAGVAARIKAKATAKPLPDVLDLIKTASSVAAIDEIALRYGSVDQLGEDGCNAASAAAVRRVEELAEEQEGVNTVAPKDDEPEQGELGV